MLEGKTVLVTGGAGGIGSAVARLSADSGANVVVCDIDADGAADVAADIGARAVGATLDITDPDAWQRVLDDASRLFDGVDVLVNNAAIDDVGPFTDMELERDRRMVEINLLGPIAGMKAVVPRMRAQGSGHIVNVTSMQAFLPMPGQATYAATKHALRALDFVLDYELRDEPIAFTLVYPPAVDTPMFDSLLDHDIGAASFAAPSIPPETMAVEIVRAMERRPREVIVPAFSGRLVRLLWSQPALVRRLLPLLERRGRAELERRRASRS